MTEKKVRAAYDTVATAYDAQFRDELDHKPLDRAMLTAFVELCGAGPIADVGCGPGHVTRFLSALHDNVIGVDLSGEMTRLSRAAAPKLSFTTASMLDLPWPDADWAGAVALYSIIHLSVDERAVAFAELARVVRAGGWLLVAFHVESADASSGERSHLDSWFGLDVDIDAYFLDPDAVTAELRTAGFALRARTDRVPMASSEFPSRRTYLVLQRVTPTTETSDVTS